MFLRPEPELGWLPTHVQVTILQARGLRAKGKHGTSDAYTLIQIGREKYSTSVVEKSPGSPEWKEECSFELAPGALERAENCELQLTVMHRALIGMDQFLGQVTIPLQHVYQEGRSQRNQWYKLRSKPGKKEKERGEIQVSIQFTRNNLTASMFDLSIKDKPKTPFGKLKDKMKVKKLFDMESSSAIVPSSVGRLDSDDEDEKKPKSKAALFLKGRLRKNSLTRSNTSLGSDSTISSTSGTVANNAGISIVLPDPGKKPASRNSSLSVEPSAQSSEASPRMTHKRAFSDEVSQLSIFPEPKVVQNLKPKGSPISKSSVCINGSHVYTETPLPKPLPSPLEKLPPVSRSFQNISKKAEESSIPGAATGQLHSLDKQEKKPIASPTPAQEEVKVPAKSKNDEIHKESKPVQITSPMVFSEEPPKVKAQDGAGKEEKKPKANLFHHDSGTKIHVEPAHQTSVASEEKAKPGSWFGSKDPKETPQKPSPHPVKPISATLSDSEKKTHKPGLTTALSSGLEMLKSVTSGQHTAPKKQEVDRLKDFSSPDLAAKYYHLTHDELISLLLQREAELGRKQNHVQELENYIDQLLVRIMDQAPTLLQVPLECKKDHK
ncbi:rab11 family-interacting protein 5 [Xenopus tropicalis]|uniref:Rab11 family-interacting protein 5 n=1 Tax=Xenopus tropicalis TaxID=8364 RepID=A0JP77_XENTR|eukprot:NP_001090651.1 rab11 family-interacting protein 5 [Xenopus tropicalis]